MTWTPLGTPVVRRGRNPLELSMLIVFLVSGITGLANAGTSSPVLALVLGGYAWMWHAGLIIGTSTSLIGIIFLKPLNDVLVERVGMIWMATCFLAYGVAVCVRDDAFFTTYTGVILGLGIAFASRAWQITGDLRRLAQTLKEMPTPGDGQGDLV